MQTLVAEAVRVGSKQLLGRIHPDRFIGSDLSVCRQNNVAFQALSCFFTDWLAVVTNGPKEVRLLPADDRIEFYIGNGLERVEHKFKFAPQVSGNEGFPWEASALGIFHLFVKTGTAFDSRYSNWLLEQLSQQTWTPRKTSFEDVLLDEFSSDPFDLQKCLDLLRDYPNLRLPNALAPKQQLLALEYFWSERDKFLQMLKRHTVIILPDRSFRIADKD